MRSNLMPLLASVRAIVALLVLIWVAQAGSLQPTAPPGPTMKTLDQIPPTWSQILPAGQRFQLVMGGQAVLDKETGLVWEQSPSSVAVPWYLQTWPLITNTSAPTACLLKNVGSRMGWRVPAAQELATLLDITQNNPALPLGHPFS